MKRVLVVIILCISSISFAQKAQRIAYIDMNYILENVPEYVEAQYKLDEKIVTWQNKLDVLNNEIDTEKTDLSNEKPLLTKELINEREEDILIKEQELSRLQIAYFGPTGDLFQLRKQLAKPVQDQVYNAIQEISERKRYDFVLDKSSDLILLYSNTKYDISELVLNSIVKGRKKKVIADRKTERIAKAAVVNPTVLEDKEGEIKESENKDYQATDSDLEIESKTVEPAEKTDAEIKAEERAAKRNALKARIKAQQEARIRMRDSLKRVADEKRAAQLREIEERKKRREEQINNN